MNMFPNEGDAGRILRVDEIKIHSSRILRRDSSTGESSRIYHRSAEGVPFNWETQPGTPKHPRREEAIPPPTPPPGARSFFPPIKPFADHSSKDDNSHAMHKSWFWRKHWKKQQTHRDYFGRKCQVVSSNVKSKNSDDLFGNYFDGESAGCVGDSSSSESKSSCEYSSNGSSRELKDDGEHCNNDHEVHKPFGCSPWNMTGIMVRVVKRV
ncbi:hypothetical protein DCAR_0520584 [Daucus carota subsp. sativus]|uniref:Uncharacterized protein n=2 Tax=Daucus carota subsp. sativus TaxID=79200 RepID=A0AAF0X431_DAUCS|nr:PREDICTED: uncharacterized protein LOC108221559 [Daucus carota subsp. sativus]WOH01203.1 hypothetical protein DCAR_0520584 [Daucus carota subsp. sativus]